MLVGWTLKTGRGAERVDLVWAGTFRIRWFSVSATYTRSPLMATPWGELKEASENVPSFLPLSGPGTEEITGWK